jgi:hypothetical protein
MEQNTRFEVLSAAVGEQVHTSAKEVRERGNRIAVTVNADCQIGREWAHGSAIYNPQSVITAFLPQPQRRPA